MKGSVHVRGSSTLAPPVRLAAEAFMSEADSIVPVSAGGTERGLRALVDGTADLAMASSEISEDLKKYAAKQGFALAVTPLAHDAIIPCVHPANPVTDLSLAQLRAIFAGQIRNWREVGGPDRSIALISYDPYQGTFESWMQLVMAEDKISPRAVIVDPSEVAARLAQAPDAIAYIASTKINATVKPLSVGGIKADLSTIKACTFLVCRTLSVVSAREPAPTTARFIEFLRHPAKGQRLLADFGNVPVE